MPAAATVGEAIVGFCDTDTKPPGPVHEYDAPATLLADRFRGEPAQTGLLEDAVGVDGIGFTTAVVVDGLLTHPLWVTVSV